MMMPTFLPAKGIDSLPQIQLQPDNVNLRYFKLRIFDLTVFIV